MKPIWKFRLFALLILVLVGGISILNLVAEFLRPGPFTLSSKTSTAATPKQISSAALASAIAPFRSDLKADYALALVGQSFKSEDAEQAKSNEAARSAVKNALTIGPHDSRMWLALALLQSRSNPDDRLVPESLKMSYLTAPNGSELIATRLDIATSGNSLNDADLKEFARGDVRAMLAQRPDQRQLLISDYVRGSSVGKQFLEESARMFDPKFADALRGAK